MAGDGTSTDGGTGHYDTTYSTFAADLQAAIRADAYGEDIGQNSWLTADEHRGFFAMLELGPSSHVLDVASGSGGPALFMARSTGCQVTGFEIHGAAVEEASAAAKRATLSDRVRFVQGDARQPLPFHDGTFDAVICVDSMNHLFDRQAVLDEWHRVVRPGGRILFTDPITVTGLLRRDEMITRSTGMGEFVFTPPGVDEALVRTAGFIDIQVSDHTDNVAEVASNRAAARERRSGDLERVEGADASKSLTQFLEVVALLARERRLSRMVYVARRPSAR
jgi:SAM-dependent methyltransferase